MKYKLLFFLLLFSSVLKANQTIIPFFAKWKVLDDGSNQDSSWRYSSYNDSGWAQRYAQLGYGDGDETSIVSYGSNPLAKNITTYFRKQIYINDPSQFSWFTLNLRRDDGVVVYVNGIEVYRNNLPAPPAIIDYNTWASVAADDGNIVQSQFLYSSVFSNGMNQIAVEIHQSDPGSADLTFDLELIGTIAATPGISRGPYLQIATPQSMVLRWRTDAISDSKVMIGSSPGTYTASFEDTNQTTEHIVHVTGLTPDTKYYYSIGTTTSILQGDEENYFITSPPSNSEQKIRLWATGDFGIGTNSASQVRSAFYNYVDTNYTNGWLWLGDNAYNSGTDIEYSTKVFNYRYEHILKKTCVWSAPGNHDYANTGYLAPVTLGTNYPYFATFTTPQAAEAGGVASGSPKYYSYNIANVHCISLDSYGSLCVPGSPMYTWLQADLSANTKRWTIVYFHHPPYTKGSHDSDLEIELIQMRSQIIPLLETYKVDLVLSGHSHCYERSYLIQHHYGEASSFNASNQVDAGSGYSNSPYFKTSGSAYAGTVYAVVGCSGQTIGGVSAGYPHNAMYTSTLSTYGSMWIEIEADTLHATLINNNVQSPGIFDEFRLIKQCSPFAGLQAINPLCVNDSSIELTAGTPVGGVYTGNGVNANYFDPSQSGAGTHQISYAVSDFYGCTDTAFTNMIVHSLPVVNVPDITMCEGDTIELQATPAGGLFSIPNPYTGPSVSYTYQYIDSNGCSIISTPALLSTQVCSKLNLKLFLQGYYEANGLMRAALYNQNQSGNPQVTDSIMVVLHDTMAPFTSIDSAVALLYTSGESRFVFPNRSGEYYIQIKHRNTIDTWSANPISISGISAFDFTTSSSNTYANNVAEVEPDVFALYTGDVNGDLNIDLLDANIVEEDVNNFQFGYLATDLNGDGNVDLLDNPILEENVSQFVFSNHP